MSISDKITYLNDTKTQIRDGINALGGSLDSDDTFRSYVDELDNIWEELPHTTETGTNITINGTKKGKAKVVPEGNTEQDTTTGKNLIGYDNSLPYTLWGITLSKSDDFYTITGTATNYFFKKIFTIPAGTLNGIYLLKKFNLSGTSLAQIRIVDRVATPNSVKAETNSQTTFSIDNTHNDLDVEITTDNNSQYNETFNILMQLSSIADTTYEPYTGGIPSPNPSFPQDVHIVSGDNTVTTTGANLFNVNGIDDISSASYKINIVNDTIVITDNTISSGYTNTGKKLKDLCPNLKVNDVVYLFFNTTSSVSNKNYIYLNAIWANGSSKTITQEMLDSNLQLYGGYNETAVISNFIITKDNDSTYEPYTSTSYPINLPDGMFLGEISTYKDSFFKAVTGNSIYDNLDSATKETLDYGEWYLEKKIGKVVLDGSENWDVTSTDTSSVYRRMTTVLAGQTISPTSASQVGLMLCNRYLAKSASDTYLKNVGVSMARSGYLEIYDSDFTTVSVSSYKTWLSSNNVILYYVLATPTYTPITGTLKDELEAVWRANSYKGTTNVSQVNNDLPFNLSVTALGSE